MFDAIGQALTAVRNEGAISLIAVTGIFALGAMIFAPRSLLCVISGWIFGFSSVLPIIIGWTLGSILAFQLTRQLFRSKFQNLITNRINLQRLIQIIEKEGFKIILMLRIASPIPGTLLSYISGLTDIPVLNFSVASMIGITPQVIIFVYLGISTEGLANGQYPNNLNIAILITGLIITALVTVFIKKRMKLATAAPKFTPS